jgi:hypothetical protein
MILVLDKKKPEEAVISLGFAVWNVQKYSPHCKLDHCLNDDGSKMVITFVYCKTQTFVSSGTSHTEGDAIMTGSLQAITI